MKFNVTKFLDNSYGTLNKHETLIWGQDPMAAGTEIQFLKGPVREYLKRADELNDANKRLSPFDWAILVGCGVIGLASFVVFTGVFLGISPWQAAYHPVLFPILIVGFVASIVVSAKCWGSSSDRSFKRLGDDLGDLMDQYAVAVHPEAADDDLRERNGLSPFGAAMDRITPDARDAIVALLDAEDEEAVMHIVKALIDEERDLIDGQRYPERGKNEARIADITETVLKKMTRPGGTK